MTVNRSWLPFGLSDRAQFKSGFIDVLEHVDETIRYAKSEVKSPWTTDIVIPHMKHEPGSGFRRKIYRFHNSTGDMRGLHTWQDDIPTRLASSTLPAIDRCSDNPQRVGWGWSAEEYGGIKKSIRTDPMCMPDIQEYWKYQEQLALALGSIGAHTRQAWTNLHQQAYLMFISNAQRGFVMTRGGASTVNFTYDPRYKDSDGDNIVKVPAGTEIAPLSWGPLEYEHRVLEYEASGSALGNSQGQPIWGMEIDIKDFNDMIRRDPELHTDINYSSKADMLLEGFGGLANFRGFSPMHSTAQVRLSFKRTSGGYDEYKVVDPLIDQAAGVSGVKSVVNPDYLRAQVALTICIAKDVYSCEIPMLPPRSIQGMVFPAAPSLEGQWWFINTPGEQNLLGEEGFFFARLHAYLAPGNYAEKPFAYMYSRCAEVVIPKCPVCLDSSTAAATEPVPLAATGVAADLVGNVLTVKLTKALACPAFTDVTLTGVSGGDQTSATIIETTQAPTYKLYFATAPSAATNYVATTTKVQCA